PETDVRLLNWTVSSRVSIPNVRANGVSPLPAEAFWDDLVKTRGDCNARQLNFALSSMRLASRLALSK
ncbi:hypothetical protein KH990_00005, partial [Methanoculleus bourgensis]|uniref:hypothetical protein n=1 Tax=Methanoculleus bourgensis TaxID=83986 RepID=UPI001BDA5F20